MADKDKKIVNTEEQNRPVNPAGGENQEDSISVEPSHTVETESSGTSSETRNDEADARSAVNDNDLTDESAIERIEGDERGLDRQGLES